MKKIILGWALMAATGVQAQTATSILGTWSFDKINEESLTTDEEKAAVPMLNSMFGSFEITLDKELYELNMMGQEESGAYTFANKVVTLRDGTKITFVNENSGLLAAGNASFYLKRGAYVKQDVVYKHLTKDSYDSIAVDEKLLTKKWKVEEVKAKADDEEAEMTAMLLQMMSFEFKEGGTFTLSIMGAGQPTTWSKGERKGEIITNMGEGQSGSFFLKQLSEKSMIVEMEETGALLYLVPAAE